jgi:uncharacterized protein (TIGR03437 family)
MNRVFLLVLAGQAAFAAGKLPGPTSGIYLGIWANPSLASNQERSIEIREGPAPNGINHAFNLHLVYYQWDAIAQQLDSSGVLQPDTALAGDISHGRVPVISWNCDGSTPNSNHVIAAANASEDAVITATAQALKQYPGPVLLRWFWEFNVLGNNQSCRGDTGGQPTPQVYSDFIGAWTHIWNQFQAAGATNVVFLWNPGNYNEGGNDDPHGFYPGNQYVDWIGIDTYQKTTTGTFQSDFGTFYSDFSGSQYGNKPLMVGENAAQNFADNNTEMQAPYLQGLLADIGAGLYPQLKAYDYFDQVGNAPFDWILDNNNGQGNGGLAEMAVLAGSASFSPGPMLTPGSVANGATYSPGCLVPGSWAQVQGVELSNVTRIWAASDFTGLGNGLPSSLSDVQVTVNNLPAALYYIDSGQVNFQVPAGVSGTVSVQVVRNGVASNAVAAAVAARAPGIFPNIVNGVNYPAAVFSDGEYAGDPSIGPSYRRAKPGDVIQLYATGLVAEPSGVLPVPQANKGVTVTVGTVTVPADYAGQTAYVGEFQINFTLSQQFATLPAGVYPISIQVNGVSSPATINTAPPGPIVLPVQH